ncbi:hypothetical protein [Nocardia sp. SC052]|uniref:LtfC-like domain-containing protein n=1 Tax=Nocardia sichangensis TaxID=3385975 RepID=UPI0039A1F7C2
MVTLGDVPAPLTLSLDPAANFVGRIELRTAQGVAVSWPDGTTAEIQLTARGTDFEAVWTATVAGPLMSWAIPSVNVQAVPRHSWAQLWLFYPDSEPLLWAEGNVEFGCRKPGFGYVLAVPQDGPGVVAVPVPGPPGPPGDAATSRVVLTGTAGVPLGGHRAVYRRGDEQIEYASCVIPAHMDVPIWVTLGAANAGDLVSMVALGEITEGSWSWTAGGAIFLGTNGLLTQTPPVGADFLAVLGTATTLTSIYVDRQPSIDLV